MPTYTINSIQNFSQAEKQSLAKRFVDIHSSATGGERYVVQVIFNRLDHEDHYLGGVPTHQLKRPLIFANLQMYEGRKHEVKSRIMNEVSSALCAAANVPKEAVMVYIQDVGVNNTLAYLSEASLEKSA